MIDEGRLLDSVCICVLDFWGLLHSCLRDEVESLMTGPALNK